MPVFPPREASTIARSVVGTRTSRHPLMYSEAAKAVMSQMTPPPTPAIVASLPRERSVQKVSRARTLSHCFVDSPAGSRRGLGAEAPNLAAVFESNTVTDASGHA